MAGSTRKSSRSNAPAAAARGATIYVNLEPCSHTGRTAPCSRSIIATGIKRVVAAIQDPNPLVAGAGFRELRGAGIEVDIGAADAEAHALNESFAKWIRTRLPFVTLKSAMTLDGKIATARGQTTSITSSASREAVQQLRHASDAILTGIGTVLTDDPLLTDRTSLPRRRPLLRVVMDSRLRLPLRSALVKISARRRSDSYSRFPQLSQGSRAHPRRRRSRAIARAR